MRSNLILLTLLTCIPLSWMHPFVGVLTWCWLSFMNPHQLVWGLATELRLNLIISLVTILGYIFSKEPKSIPNNACVYLLFALAILWIISAKMALAPQISDPLLTRHLKTFVLLIMVLALVNSRLRLHALVTVIVISIGYYGVYGGLVGVLSGGASRFAGPPSSQIADNNHLALAIIVIIPLANWLRMHSSNKLVKLALLASMGCGVLGVLVTYSRGGLLGLAAMGSILWWKSKHKLLSLIIMAAIALPAISLLPQEWWDRMDTIKTADQDDQSFQGRLAVWEASFNLAVDHPIFGGGFSATQNRDVYEKYEPPGSNFPAHAAHSIYFQVMADMGFVGLAVYLMIVFATWRNSVAVVRIGSRMENMTWATDLAKMLQVSFAGYLVAGAALSMAYYDVALTLMVVLINLRAIVEKERKLADAATRGQRRFAPAFAASRN